MSRSKVKKSDSTSVTLQFHNQEERNYFMGQLSDGWGENYVYLDWSPQEEFDACHFFTVTLAKDELAEIERHKSLSEKRAKRILNAKS